MTRRKAFGKMLIDHPLHVKTLARLEVSRIFPLEAFVSSFHALKVEVRGNLILLFEVAKLLGLEENQKITEEHSLLLRLLTPLLKLYNAKMVNTNYT